MRKRSMTALPVALAGLLVLALPGAAAEESPICFEHDAYYRNGDVLDIAEVVDFASFEGRTIDQIVLVYSANLPGKRLHWKSDGEMLDKVRLQRGPKRLAALDLDRQVAADFSLAAEFHMTRDRVRVLEVQVVLAPEGSAGP